MSTACSRILPATIDIKKRLAKFSSYMGRLLLRVVKQIDPQDQMKGID